MLTYQEIKEVISDYDENTLINDYNNRQAQNKHQNEVVTRKVVECLYPAEESMPVSYATKLNILISAILNSGNKYGIDLARRTLERFNYHINQELIVSTQYIDLVDTEDISKFLFLQIVKGLTSISITEKKPNGYHLSTPYGNTDVIKAHEVLGLKPIPTKIRRQLCHQITTEGLLSFPELYGAYYYIPQAFSGYLEHSVLLNPDKNIVIDLANNATTSLDVWHKTYSYPAFTIKGHEFIDLYKRYQDDYGSTLHMAILEEVRRVRNKHN